MGKGSIFQPGGCREGKVKGQRNRFMGFRGTGALNAKSGAERGEVKASEGIPQPARAETEVEVDAFCLKNGFQLQNPRRTGRKRKWKAVAGNTSTLCEPRGEGGESAL